MTYSFTCPFPCNYEIKVDARNNHEAVNKIIRAGAICCRNVDNQCYCEKADRYLFPLPHGQLRNIVRLCIQEGYDLSASSA
jgi:hypothetical protein